MCQYANMLICQWGSPGCFFREYRKERKGGKGRKEETVNLCALCLLCLLCILCDTPGKSSLRFIANKNANKDLSPLAH